MNNTTNTTNITKRLEFNLENPVTVPAYIFVILGGVINLLFITLACTCCCNDIICCRPWRREDPTPQPIIIGAVPSTPKMVLRTRQSLRRTRGTDV